MGMTWEEALSAIEYEYKFAMGIAPRNDAGFLDGMDGEPLIVDNQGLANSMRDREVAAERYIRWVRPTIENPYEILLVDMETSENETFEVKKYIALYGDKSGRRESLVVFAVWSSEHQMWKMHHFLPVPQGELDGHRHAKKVLYVRPERSSSGELGIR